MNRMQRWRDRKRQEGLIEVRVLVPAAERETIRAVAAALRPVPEEIDGQVVEPAKPDRPPSAKFIAYAEGLAKRNEIEIPPPVRRSHNRLLGWCHRNKHGWSWEDQRAEERRLQRIAKLRAELEELT